MKTGPNEVVATELNIYKRTASITYRTPGLYSLRLPIGDLEVRFIGQGGQGGGGGAGYSSGGVDGKGGGQIVPGQTGEEGQYLDTGWQRLSSLINRPHDQYVVLDINVAEGGEGGRGVGGLHGAKGKDGWICVEIRWVGILGRLRYTCKDLWVRISQWSTWQKAGVIAAVTSAIAGILTLLLFVFI